MSGTKIISIYISEDFLNTIEEKMKQLGFQSRSEFFRTCARFYLLEIEKIKEVKKVEC